MGTQSQTTTENIFPFERMRLGQRSITVGAKKHLADILEKKKPRWFSRFLSRKSPAVITSSNQILQSDSEVVAIHDSLDIDFNDRRTDQRSNYTSDRFKWAVLCENQRGFVFFSTPCFSSRSLLPPDPPAFTSPDTELSAPPSHRLSRNVTLETYPLPDPTWRWVSTSWFVDMRGDGEVQHDGFEYNWYFRSSKWRSKAGWFSAGGLVRRRRWVRLMVRPSDDHLEAEATERQQSFEDKAGESLVPVCQPDDFPIWRGNEYDWQRLRKILKILARDEQKLQLWKSWLTDIVTERQSKFDPEVLDVEIVVTVDEYPQLMDERPSKEWLLSILKEHADDLRYTFVYPESWLSFGQLLLTAGLLQKLMPDARSDKTHISTVLTSSALYIDQ